MKIPSNPEARFQLGVVSSEDSGRPFDKDSGASFYVSFGTPYKTPPAVLAWLTHIDIDGERKCAIKTYAKNITTNGFLLHIPPWSDSSIVSAKVGWLAYNPATSGIASGSQVLLAKVRKRKSSSQQAGSRRRHRCSLGSRFSMQT